MDRVTHAYDGTLALFLIGVRIHQPWKVRTVRRAAAPMAGMITELERNKAAAERGEAEHLGYLGSRTTFDLSGPTVIQWWRSVEDIYPYANSDSLRHRPAWLEFYRAAKSDPKAVTIWHETYTVPAGAVESIYSGPRPFGLARLVGVIPVGRRGETARERMAQHGTGTPAA